MSYRIEILKKARKFIVSQPLARQKQLIAAILKLPTSGDIVPMQGRTETYRLRVGSYRVLFKKDDNVLIITVVDAGNRGDIY